MVQALIFRWSGFLILQAEFDAVRSIHLQKKHSGAPGSSQTHDLARIRPKMLRPGLYAWVKQNRYATPVRIDAGQVRTFKKIAMMARKTEIVCAIRPPMLTGNDVFYMIGEERLPEFRHFAVLATFAGPIANETPVRRRNAHSLIELSLRRALD
jgi:hypothetical protein